MVRAKTLIPNDFRDFLSIISLIGFLAIFSKFVLDNSFLSDNLNALFLMIAGVGLLVLGKALTINKWIRDGIQQGETLQIFSIALGIPAIVIGVLMLLNVSLPQNVTGFIGFVALGPAIFIVIDYLAKNTRNF